MGRIIVSSCCCVSARYGSEPTFCRHRCNGVSMLVLRGSSIICPFPSKYLKVGHYWPASETPYEWRFAGGSEISKDCMLAGCGS